MPHLSSPEYIAYVIGLIVFVAGVISPIVLVRLADRQSE